MYILPKLGHYRVRPEILAIDGSAATHRLVKVPREKLAVWDSSHDASGQVVKDGSEEKRVEDADEFRV